MQYVPNKHVAIRSLGKPDDESYALQYERGYKRLVLTWFDVKTPDGKHWDKLSVWFHNYAPDYEFHSLSVIQPSLPGYKF